MHFGILLHSVRIRQSIFWYLHEALCLHIYNACGTSNSHQRVTVIDIRHNLPLLGLFCFLGCECGMSRGNVQTLHYVGMLTAVKFFLNVLDCVNCNVEIKPRKICLEFEGVEFAPRTFIDIA